MGSLTAADAEAMIESGVITEGMIPRCNAASMPSPEGSRRCTWSTGARVTPCCSRSSPTKASVPRLRANRGHAFTGGRDGQRRTSPGVVLFARSRECEAVNRVTVAGWALDVCCPSVAIRCWGSTPQLDDRDAASDASDEGPIVVSDASSDAPMGQSDGGGEDAPPDAKGAACRSLRATDACNRCVAANCCPQYDACLADPDCKSKLVTYAFCLGKNFTSDAGITCDEEFVGVSQTAAELANCAFRVSCPAECTAKSIGDLCFTYCGCMNTICEDRPFDGGTCEEVCENFTKEQLICRPYHCGLATTNQKDEALRILHCGHASGVATCP